MHFVDVTNVEEYRFEPQNHIFDHFFTISVFWLMLLRVFFFIQIFIIFSYFLFYFKRTMKIITGRRPWVNTEESHRLTTMDDINTLAVFAGYHTRSLFAFPGLINLNEIKIPALECLLPCIEHDSLRFCLFTRAFPPPQAYFQQ